MPANHDELENLIRFTSRVEQEEEDEEKKKQMFREIKIKLGYKKNLIEKKNREMSVKMFMNRKPTSEF